MHTGNRIYGRWSGATASALALFLLAAGTVGATPRPIPLRPVPLRPVPLRPAPISDTSSPSSTLASYYNALDRGEYLRAYGYLIPQTRPPFSRFLQVHQNVLWVRLVSVRLMGYTDVSSVHAEMCVGIHLLSADRLGHRVRYHGWYILRAMSGEEPNFGDWRIDLPASRILLDRRSFRPMQEQHCRVV